MFPPDAAPLTAAAPEPVYVKDDEVLPYEPMNRGSACSGSIADDAQGAAGSHRRAQCSLASRQRGFRSQRALSGWRWRRADVIG
jgi:hypothetical protein